MLFQFICFCSQLHRTFQHKVIVTWQVAKYIRILEGIQVRHAGKLKLNNAVQSGPLLEARGMVAYTRELLLDLKLVLNDLVFLNYCFILCFWEKDFFYILSSYYKVFIVKYNYLKLIHSIYMHHRILSSLKKCVTTNPFVNLSIYFKAFLFDWCYNPPLF